MADKKGKPQFHNKPQGIITGIMDKEINNGFVESRKAPVKESRHTAERKSKKSPNKHILSTNSEQNRPKSAKHKVLTVKSERERQTFKAELQSSSRKLSTEKYIFDKARKDIWAPVEPKLLAEKLKETETFIKCTRSILENEHSALIKTQKVVVPLLENRIGTVIGKAMIDKIKNEVKKPHLLMKKHAMANDDSIKCIFDRNRLLHNCPSKMFFENKESNKNVEEIKNNNNVGADEDQSLKNVSTQEVVDFKSNKNTEEELKTAKAEKAQKLKTSLSKKSKKEKENILRIMAKAGLPLPIGKSESEKRMIGKVRAEMGLPQIEEKSVKATDIYPKHSRKLILSVFEKRVTSEPK